MDCHISDQNSPQWDMLIQTRVFVPHPLFSGVGIYHLPIEQVPGPVAYVIRAINGKILSFCEIHIEWEIPRHQHLDDGEMYFGGDPCATVVLENPESEVQKFVMGNRCGGALLRPGGSHSVTSSRPTTFFGVKFKIETSDSHWAVSPTPQ